VIPVAKDASCEERTAGAHEVLVDDYEVLVRLVHLPRVGENVVWMLELLEVVFELLEKEMFFLSAFNPPDNVVSLRLHDTAAAGSLNFIVSVKAQKCSSSQLITHVERSTSEDIVFIHHHLVVLDSEVLYLRKILV